MMYCLRCTYQAQDDALYCPRCGEGFAETKPSRSSDEGFRDRQSSLSRSIRGGPVILTIVLLVVVGVAAWTTSALPRWLSGQSEDGDRTTAQAVSEPNPSQQDRDAPTVSPPTPATLTSAERKEITNGIGMAFLAAEPSITNIDLDSTGVLTVTIDSYSSNIYWDSDQGSVVAGLENMFVSFPNAETYRLYAPPSNGDVSEEFSISNSDLRAAIKAVGDSGKVYFNDDSVAGAVQHLVDGVKQ